MKINTTVSSAFALIGLLARTSQGWGLSQPASRLIKGVFLVVLLALSPGAGAADATTGGPTRTPDAKSILAGLRPEYPRLILTESDWKTFRAARGGSGSVAQILAVAETKARAVLDKPPVVYKKEGRRLLAVSREAMRRIELWSFAYRLTDERVFLDRVEKEMLPSGLLGPVTLQTLEHNPAK